MASKWLLYLLPACFLTACDRAPGPRAVKRTIPPFDAALVRLSPPEIVSLPLATRFDPPMGGENQALVYNAQPFQITRHLGDDLNGIGGWNSDLGDPVFAAGAGRVIYQGVPSAGWGNMLILGHRVPDPAAPLGYRIYETVYAHMLDFQVPYDATVHRGQLIGHVGTANGKYFAHLHFEVRECLSIYPGAGYADAPLDRISGEYFISTHRGAPEDQILPAPDSKN